MKPAPTTDYVKLAPISFVKYFLAPNTKIKKAPQSRKHLNQIDGKNWLDRCQHLNSMNMRISANENIV